MTVRVGHQNVGCAVTPVAFCDQMTNSKSISWLQLAPACTVRIRAVPLPKGDFRFPNWISASKTQIFRCMNLI